MIVSPTDEFRRIAAVPRRDPASLVRDDVAEAVTRALRMPGSARVFFPIQAAALVATCRAVELGSPGAFLPIGVGEGKTDITFCLPYVLDAKRAILLVPGALTSSKGNKEGKTERDFRALRSAWKERPYFRIISYQKIGRANGGDELIEAKPDVIVCDEAHMLRNVGTDGTVGAAVARVVTAYVRAARQAGHRVILVVLSGTMTGGKLGHMSHLAELSLGKRSFLPNDEYDLDMWRRAVDAEVEAGGRVGPGCLLDFCNTDDLKGTQLARARRAIRRRMHETEGVIASTTRRVRASLRFNRGPEAGGAVPLDMWAALRDDWRLPSGDRCLDGFEIHRHAREYALGYWGEWDPPPPRPWYKARSAWSKEVYAAIASRACNTEVEARALLDSDAWHAWADIRDTYTPNPVARWVSTATLEACARWADTNAKSGGIIWTQHIPFGERLERDFGIPYYREQGLRADGQYIEQASGVVCASVQANATGRNLQHNWSRNLIASPFGSAEMNEQCFGRTHRTGQRGDEVTVDFLVECREHVSALRRARERADAIALMTDNPQKLSYGDWLFRPESCEGSDARWRARQDEDDDGVDAGDNDFLNDIIANNEIEDEAIL